MADMEMIRKVRYYRELRASGYPRKYSLTAAELTADELEKSMPMYYNWERRAAAMPQKGALDEPMPTPPVCFSEHLAAVLGRPYVRKRIINHIAADTIRAAHDYQSDIH